MNDREPRKPYFESKSMLAIHSLIILLLLVGCAGNEVSGTKITFKDVTGVSVTMDDIGKPLSHVVVETAEDAGILHSGDDLIPFFIVSSDDVTTAYGCNNTENGEGATFWEVKKPKVELETFEYLVGIDFSDEVREKIISGELILYFYNLGAKGNLSYDCYLKTPPVNPGGQSRVQPESRGARSKRAAVDSRNRARQVEVNWGNAAVKRYF